MEIIIIEEAKKRLKQNNQYGWAFVEYLFVPRKYMKFFWGITLLQSSGNYHYMYKK
jgi:hypothetical protein